MSTIKNGSSIILPGQQGRTHISMAEHDDAVKKVSSAAAKIINKQNNRLKNQDRLIAGLVRASGGEVRIGFLDMREDEPAEGVNINIDEEAASYVVTLKGAE